MAIDFQQIYNKIKEIGQSVQERQETLDQRRRAARALFEAYANDLDGLRAKLDSALLLDAKIRCAYPLDEALDTRVPAPDSAKGTLIAADGSQVVPDRHAAVQFGLVNVGAIALRLDSGNTPDVFTDSTLYYGDELLTEYGTTLSEGTIALRRDLAERRKLEELAKLYEPPVVTFTDGPIELWGNKEQDKAYAVAEKEYLATLSRLEEQGVITAGYVDKPSSNYVVQLLEIMMASPDELKDIRRKHDLLGVTDLWLFGKGQKKPLLQSGERSAVFELQSTAKKNYKGGLSLHFFYLNVGTEGHPYPVRVEVPKWVVDDKEKLDNLHAVLVQQCRTMGAKPTPYLLHRSHEVAMVSFAEKRQIEQMLMLELRRSGGEVGEISGKQSAKDVSGK